MKQKRFLLAVSSRGHRGRHARPGRRRRWMPAAIVAAALVGITAPVTAGPPAPVAPGGQQHAVLAEAAEAVAPAGAAEATAVGHALAAGPTRAAAATSNLAATLTLRVAAQQRVATQVRAAVRARTTALARARAAEQVKMAAPRAPAPAAVPAASPAVRAAAPSAAPTTSSTPTLAASVVAFARAQIGKAYAMGATGPDAYDCSGLVQAAYASIGVTLPRVSQDQSTAGTPVPLDALQPGDILYWGSAGSAYHVAIYIGTDAGVPSYIGAQNPSSGTVERSLGSDPPTGAVRVLGAS